MYPYNRDILKNLNNDLINKLAATDPSKDFCTVFLKEIAYNLSDEVPNVTYLQGLSVASKISVDVSETIDNEEDEILVRDLASIFTKSIIKITTELCNGEFSVKIAKNIASQMYLKLDN